MEANGTSERAYGFLLKSIKKLEEDQGAIGLQKLLKFMTDNFPVAVGNVRKPDDSPKSPKLWNPGKEMINGRFSRRRKDKLLTLLNVATKLLDARGSRRKLREFVGKIENAFKELESACEEYQSFLDQEELEGNLTLINELSNDVDRCLERIELQLSEREREPPSESGSEVVAPSIKFQGSVPRSNKSSSSSLSATKQQARVAQLKLEQAKKEVQQRAAEEQQLFEERLKIQAREHALAEKRRIRELEYEAEKLRLETQLDGEYHPENLENRLRDFSDSDSETEYREIKERQPDIDDKTKVLADKPHFTSPGLQLPPPIKSSTERKGTLPSAIHPTNSQIAEERLDVSWIKELSKRSTERQAAVEGMSASIFAKSMPRLKLPHFSGDPLEWPQFIALFKCLVHDQPLTDTQRMTHLQSALTGDAKKAIGGMLNHGHLYKAALTELEAQFGSEEIVARAFMKTVFDHPKVPEGDLTQLRSFYNTLHVAVVTLNSLGYVHDLSSTVTTQRVLQKLPNLLKERWGEKKIQTHPTQLTLLDLDEWLGTRVRAKASVSEQPTRSDHVTSNRTEGTTNRRQLARRRRESDNNTQQPARAATFATAAPTKEQHKLPVCRVCSKEHSIEHCDKFKNMNLNQRATFGKENNLCFLCFNSTDHQARNCPRKQLCDVGDCNKRHHPLIHGADRVFVGTSSKNCAPTTVLLQIVPIVVTSQEGSNVQTFALLDSGSQTSLVLEDFANKVGFDGITSTLHLGTVNSRDEAVRSRKVSFKESAVNKVEDSHEVVVEEAWTVPQLNIPEQKRVEEWWRTDAFGTKYENETPRSVEDKKALEILENTVKHLGDRYEVGMLWRDQDVEFPDNRVMAEKRLKSTERRLKRDETLAVKYCAIIDDYVNKGYAKKLSPKEASMPTCKQWFLPHHPVLNANKPGKVRIVMDAAAKHDGVSLNDKLLIGPDLLNNLVGVLLRFREERVGVSADIEAMFHQCSIIAQDQPALRFLWRNLELNRAPDVYQMQVMIFGAAASPYMANYVLRKTAIDNCDDPSFNVDTIESVEKNFYMDDFLKSVQDEATAIRLCQEITSLLARGGFRLTKWVSSSREVLSQIPTEEKANPSIDLNFDDLPIERTLGLKWNTQTDSFRFSVNSHKSTDVTKRSVLSMVSTVFDPLGVLTPFLLPAKCLIQTLWQKGKGWDEPLDPDDERIWTGRTTCTNCRTLSYHAVSVRTLTLKHHYSFTCLQMRQRKDLELCATLDTRYLKIESKRRSSCPETEWHR
ncbi:hypothetical protein QZH41_006069 [Actinostola sp. cb2023]|nr:hypothetical protein QZH41_006069 [Actinostola sp. cb2023]